ncbi:sigma 54-interacting transcriptional regulator [Vibrio sp.]|nr:sigma 54-interacting transcriptional regulator [Vibrio sp.]
MDSFERKTQIEPEKEQQWYEELNYLPQANEADKLNEQLSKAWQQFLEGNQPDWIRQSVIASWRRSLERNIDPYTFVYKIVADEELSMILYKNREMIDIARSVMQDLLAYNPDGHINLADENGIALCYCGADLTPVGGVLNEEEQGTNCTALCLIEKKPVYTVSGENWKIAHRKRQMQCAAAPVKNAQGKMIGVLTLTSSQENFNYQTLGTVHAAAQAIRQQLILKDLLIEQQTILETLNEGVIVFDRQGIIQNANRYARQIFSNFNLIGKHIDRDLQPEDITLLESPACNDKEVVFNIPAHLSISCLISVIGAPNGNKVISLKENQRIRDITRRVMGVGATYTFERIIGNSPRLKSIIDKAKKASLSDSTVLITGESGTGKELFAQALHNHSNRHAGPFIAVNCGAIPRDLVQSELFGYTDGAYTGSRKGGASGKFELADGGTLFLDEIGEMPLEAQTSLLRVLQEGEVMRIGAAKPIKIDVRIIAATNCNLIKAVDQSSFRRDLYYRLNVISLQIPPLRERAEDICDLVEFFASRLCNNLKKIRPTFSHQVQSLLRSYQWPGNVRELENTVERLINLNSGLEISQADLPDEIAFQSINNKVINPTGIETPIPEKNKATYESTPISLEGNEKQHIITLLKANNGNVRQTAEVLRVSRNCLYGKLKKWQIKIDEYRL